MGFWVRLGSAVENAGHFVLRDVNGLEVIWFYATDVGRFFVNADVGGDVAIRYDPNRWYQIEFRNIDYARQTFEYWINRQRIRRSIPFRNRGSIAVEDIHHMKG